MNTVGLGNYLITVHHFDVWDCSEIKKNKIVKNNNNNKIINHNIHLLVSFVYIFECDLVYNN